MPAGESLCQVRMGPPAPLGPGPGAGPAGADACPDGCFPPAGPGAAGSFAQAAVALGASEPLPPSWASSINIHCVRGCVGALGRDPEAHSKGWAGQGWTEIHTDNIIARAGIGSNKYNFMVIVC